MGTTARWLRWTVIELAVTGMLFLVGMKWGPVGVAGAWTTSYCVLIVPGFLYALKPLNFSITLILSSTWRYAVAALVAAFACARVLKYMPMPPHLAINGLGGAIVRIVAYNALFGLLYLLLIVALFGSMEPLRQFGRLMPDLLPKISFLRRGKKNKVQHFSPKNGEPEIAEIGLDNTP